MTPRAFRFRPPRVPLDGAIRWTLLRAFGPLGAPAARSFDAGEAVAWARRLSLTPRIAARHDFATLVEELGDEQARGIQVEGVAIEAESERLRRTARTVAERASEAGIPLVFLKYLALELDGRLLPGSRPAADADVLVDADRGPALVAALTDCGYSAQGLPGADHQLPTLGHPDLAPVEVHVSIPGVRLEGARLATFSALRRRHLLTPLAHLPGACFLPTVTFRIAHALAHGIAHHGFSPADYPMARLFADLIDLGVSGRDPSLELELAVSWIAGAVAAEEAWAAIDLAEALASSALDELDGEPNSHARRLLDHLLAGQIDDHYRRGLELHLVRPGLSERAPHRELARRLWGLFVKSNAELEVVYGPSASPVRRLLLRLVRPLHLAWKLTRSVWGELSTRLRAREP